MDSERHDADSNSRLGATWTIPSPAAVRHDPQGTHNRRATDSFSPSAFARKPTRKLRPNVIRQTSGEPARSCINHTRLRTTKLPRESRRTHLSTQKRTQGIQTVA